MGESLSYQGIAGQQRDSGFPEEAISYFQQVLQ
jgi:hypothetical protein